MLFNFNIVDESMDDVPATKEQVAAEINYDISLPIPKRKLLIFDDTKYNEAITILFCTLTGL